MKLHGDVSKEHQKLANDLVEMEAKIRSNNFTTEKCATMYVCLAHDWFDIGMEEEGLRLLAKAETVCPGYFEHVQAKHMKENADYNTLVLQLAGLLLSLGIKNERR